MAQEVFTSQEAASFVRLKPETFETYRIQGKGPKFVRIGHPVRGRVRYLRKHIDEWLESQVYENTSVPESITPARRVGVEIKSVAEVISVLRPKDKKAAKKFFEQTGLATEPASAGAK